MTTQLDPRHVRCMDCGKPCLVALEPGVRLCGVVLCDPCIHVRVARRRGAQHARAHALPAWARADPRDPDPERALPRVPTRHVARLDAQEEGDDAVNVQTVEVPAHCRACGGGLRVRLEIGAYGGTILCAACLDARVEAVRVERETRPHQSPKRGPGRLCQAGHRLEGDNLGTERSPTGTTWYHCKTCKRTQTAAWRARRALQGDAA